MHGFIFIGVFLVSIFSLLNIAAHWLNYVDGPSLIFTFGLTSLLTLLTHGVEGLKAAIGGGKYLFAYEIVGGKRAQYLVSLYSSIIRFCYSSAALLFVIGLVSVIRGFAQATEADKVVWIAEFALPVLFLPLFYSVLLSEGILRPLKIKLATCDLALK